MCFIARTVNNADGEAARTSSSTRIGFDYATKAGISIGVDDMVVPENKTQLIDRSARTEVHGDREPAQYQGVITER